MGASLKGGAANYFTLIIIFPKCIHMILRVTQYGVMLLSSKFEIPGTFHMYDAL